MAPVPELVYAINASCSVPEKQKPRRKWPGLKYFIRNKLSDLYFCTCFFQLGSHFLGSSFVNAFFDGLRSTVNEVFCFLQSQTGHIFYDLDHVQFVGTSSFQNYVEG